MPDYDPVKNVLERLQKVRQTAASQWEALCPAHDDREPSLCIGLGKDGRALVHCQAGCKLENVLEKIGLRERDLFPHDDPGPDAAPAAVPLPENLPSIPPSEVKRMSKNYEYHDETGKLLYEVVRFEPKDFRMRRPDGKGGWTWNMDGTPRILYRLPELLADKTAWVFITEGEKDADGLYLIKLVSTTNPNRHHVAKQASLGQDEERSVIWLRTVPQT
jgi:hypothetical protein